MKRLLSLSLASLLAFALTGCAGLDIGSLSDPIVRVAEAVTDESTSTAKGATAGMSSGDAAKVLINRDYYGAIKAVHGAGKTAAAPQLLLDIEPLDGQPIVIHAKRFKVYAPPPQGQGGPQLSIAPPIEEKPTWLAVSQEARGWFRDAVVPWKSVDEGAKTDRLNIESSERRYGVQMETFGNLADRGIEAASKPPLVVTVPPPAAPAAATP